MSNVELKDILPAAKAEIIPPGQELEAQTKRLIKAHKEVLKAMVNGCEAAMEAGEALNEIKDKKLVQHGEFEDYVADKCGISPRTARRYMELARQKTLIEQRLTEKRSSLADLSQSEAMRMIGTLRPPKATNRKERTIFEVLKSNWNKATEDEKRKFKPNFNSFSVSSAASAMQAFDLA